MLFLAQCMSFEAVIAVHPFLICGRVFWSHWLLAWPLNSLRRTLRCHWIPPPQPPPPQTPLTTGRAQSHGARYQTPSFLVSYPPCTKNSYWLALGSPEFFCGVKTVRNIPILFCSCPIINFFFLDFCDRHISLLNLMFSILGVIFCNLQKYHISQSTLLIADFPPYV